MNPFPDFNPHPVFKDYVRAETRRQFLRRGANFLGTAALAALAPNLLFAGEKKSYAAHAALKAIGPHFPPKAKRVIYLHMVGGPSQLDLFDYKPVMNDWFDKELPDTIRMGQRITTMTSGQKRFPRCALEIQVRAARQERHVGQRTYAMDGEDGGRPDVHPLDAH
jgi:hypothetical protein